MRIKQAAAVVATSLAWPAAAHGAGATVSNVHVDIVSSSVQIPDSTEVVTLQGQLHLVVRVVPLDNGERYFTVFANLPANVSAESSTGEHFVAVGATRHADAHPGLIIPCVMPDGFSLIQADPAHAARSIAPVTFSLNLVLRINEAGEVEDGIASTNRAILDDLPR